MTIPEADNKGQTAPIELPTPASTHVEPAPISTSPAPVGAPHEAARELTEPAQDAAAAVELSRIVARPASPQERELLFVPLAINIGDGFKFGCGFFLAMVLAMLVGFVLLAAMFVLTSVFGVNLPIAR